MRHTHPETDQALVHDIDECRTWSCTYPYLTPEAKEEHEAAARFVDALEAQADDPDFVVFDVHATRIRGFDGAFYVVARSSCDGELTEASHGGTVLQGEVEEFPSDDPFAGLA